MNQIDRDEGDGPGGGESRKFWRHRSFPELGLMRARFTRHRYELHTHPTYVVALITAGCERIRIGRRTIVAPAGAIAVVNPEEWHDGESGADDGWAYRTFYPSVALMTGIARELGLAGPPMFADARLDDSVLADSLARAHRHSQSGDAAAAEESLLIAFRALIERHASVGPRRDQAIHFGARQRFSTYEEFINSEIASPITLQQLAAIAGVTRFQVIRDFKKTISRTPAAYIRDRRLRRASALIESGVGLADAAAAAGFADQSHLSRAFRAVHGVTPGMYRPSA